MIQYRNAAMKTVKYHRKPLTHNSKCRGFGSYAIKHSFDIQAQIQFDSFAKYQIREVTCRWIYSMGMINYRCIVGILVGQINK